VSIYSVVSNDGGFHFKRTGGMKALVAEMPYRFEEEPDWWGIMGPTSIVKRGDDYYVLVSMIHPTDRASNGVCVMRTWTVSDPASWRGWDGHGFTVQFVDPYELHVENPDAHLCKPLPKDAPMFTVDSLLWSPVRQSYVLVTRVQKWDKPANGEVPGAYLQESKDMIHWNKPVSQLSDAQAGGENLYPSLIDPASPDQNLSPLGNTAILFTKIGNQGYKSWKVVAREVRLQQ
jgi:hypothetical protein